MRAVSGRVPRQNTAEAAEDGAPGHAPRGTMPARSLLSASSAVHLVRVRVTVRVRVGVIGLG